MSLIVCRSIGDRRVFIRAWIYAHALEPTFAAYGPKKAGARRTMPTAPVSTGLTSAISNAGAETPQLQWSRSWRHRWASKLENCWHSNFAEDDAPSRLISVAEIRPSRSADI